MVGVICKTEILCHPWVTIECFGWMVFFRAVFAGHEQTFLSLLDRVGAFRQPVVPVPDSIHRCIELERRAQRVYTSLGLRYACLPAVQVFFEDLARQEAAHAELLELCRAAAGRSRIREDCVDQWLHLVPNTERLLSEAEASLDRHESLVDSLRLVIRMESSQINGLFTGVVSATMPRFAQRFTVFRYAVRDHLRYIQARLPTLAPGLAAECETLAVNG
jgi:hypothetical protein